MCGECCRRRGFQSEAAGSETQGHPIIGEPISPWVAVPEDLAAPSVLWSDLEVSGPPGPKAVGAQLLAWEAEWSPGTCKGLHLSHSLAPPVSCSILISAEPAQSSDLSGKNEF